MTSHDKIEGITKDELIAMIAKGAEDGALKALGRVGLHDENAVHDVKELRNLLDSWRQTKRTVRSTVIKTLTVAILGFLMGASYLKLKTWL
jgi:hypothetical protein